jgi:hypothetical protein
MLPDVDHADRIGELSIYPESRSFAELLIQRSGTVVGSVGLAQMALLVNGASSQTLNRVKVQSAPVLSLLTRERTGTGTPEADFLPRGFLHFLRADAIGAASDRSRTQSEGRSPFARELHPWPRFQPQPQTPLRVLHHLESPSVHVRANLPSGWRHWTE